MYKNLKVIFRECLPQNIVPCIQDNLNKKGINYSYDEIHSSLQLSDNKNYDIINEAIKICNGILDLKLKREKKELLI